tara:strand:- start:20361 stop:20717 length:357 start_codon:yes stop_codon:yes gene_type:complete
MKVLYNEQCPVCSREIKHYKNLIKEEIKWLDINNLKVSTKLSGKSHRELIRRIHVIKDGKVYSGLDAFILLWGKIPQYKLLSRLLSKPIIYHFSYMLYEALASLLFLINYKQLRNKSN